ncbi:MAG TPA: hypothetical protein VKE51_23860 [Vicinamibacterales bacterium]|nr:hypothetical protein [Vicinamibacterales bacterium]
MCEISAEGLITRQAAYSRQSSEAWIAPAPRKRSTRFPPSLGRRERVTRNSWSLDITTLDGYKLYRLKQAYAQRFGQLFAVNNPRYIQIGLKIFF